MNIHILNCHPRWSALHTASTHVDVNVRQRTACELWTGP